jgi:hypothetical protein
VEQNFPIPPGIYEEVCVIAQKKITAGIYELSNSSHWSWRFCVLKKDGKVLRPVNSLEPLNRVTIQHSGVPPIPEHLMECFSGCTCGGMLDLYIGYDERLLWSHLKTTPPSKLLSAHFNSWHFQWVG